jgi:hypothetical protein
VGRPPIHDRRFEGGDHLGSVFELGNALTTMTTLILLVRWFVKLDSAALPHLLLLA